MCERGGTGDSRASAFDPDSVETNHLDQLRRHSRAALLLLVCLTAITSVMVISNAEDQPPVQTDPAAWGSNHVGQVFPEYITGDECLFCHRKKIGPTWQRNAHQRTVRPAPPDDPAMAALAQEDRSGFKVANETEYLLGSRRLTRFLKRSRGYGKLDLLSAIYRPAHQGHSGRGRLMSDGAAEWDSSAFADRCAGCHATAVDAQSGAFAAMSLDCFTCHGDVDLAHTDDVSKVLLSSGPQDPQQVTSICSQCHLRGGRSASSGRPYPNTFVAGDNLFQDFEVDLTEAYIAAIPGIEQHIYQNARDVAIAGRTEVTCLSCHDVHGQSSEKHVLLERSAICATCHLTNSEDYELRPSVQAAKQVENRSSVCDY